MLPTQQYDGVPSANPMPPWTPEVWQSGPDVLVKKAQVALFEDRGEIETNALGGGTDSSAMAGSVPQPENESDQLINVSTPGDSPSGGHGGSVPNGASRGRQSSWEASVRQLYDTEPLAGWAQGQKSGPANPPA